MVRAVLPLYATRFQCTGAACEDTCCAGWGIPVDRTTFERYAAMSDASLRARLCAAVKPSPPERQSLRVWGTIALDDATGACPLLDGGLCSVHRDLGEDALSDACATYPRVLRDTPAFLVQTLTLSCPEAARLALLAEDAFQLVEQDIAPRSRPADDVTQARWAGLSHEDATAVTSFCIRLIQNAELALWMRLAILGLFCDELSSLLQRQHGGDSGALVARFEAGTEAGHFVSGLRHTQPDHALQVQVAARVLDLQVAPPGSERQRARWRTVFDGLGVATDGTGAALGDVVTRYRRGLERLPEALADAPWLLDHVVRNDLFADGFPFGAASPWQHFMQVVGRFGVVRLMLAGRCAEGPLPSAAELAATVQTFVRRYRHTPGFAARTDAALEAIGFGGLAQLYGFVRS